MMKYVTEKAKKLSFSKSAVPDHGDQQPSLPVKLALGRSQREGSTTHDVLVQIEPPADGTRTPLDICLVVDVSGSMTSECSNGDKGAESQGLSILDVVKHATKTVIHTLGPQDRFSLVSFGSVAKLVVPLTAMDKKGIKTADEATTALATQGCTELWDGLKLGLDTLQASKDPARMSAIFLLTDGQPSSTPNGGFVKALQECKGDGQDLGCSVNTFGFGYNLKDGLLPELAEAGQGSYAFIPDGSCVGTVFVNATSNVLASAARNVTVKIECEAKNLSCPGWTSQTKASWGLQVSIGSLQFGQSRDIIVTVEFTPDELVSEDPSKLELGVEVTMEPINVKQSQKQTLSGSLNLMTGKTSGLTPPPPPVTAAPADAAAEDGGVVGPDAAAAEAADGDGDAATASAALPETEVVAQRLRSQCVDRLSECVSTPADAQVLIDELIKQLDEFVSKSPGDARMVDLRKDLAGQVTEALSENYYRKWGKHFLPSLLNAHRLQQCNNFKDPGVQHYGGMLFESLRDKAEENFMKLPAPKPSTARSRPAAAAAVNMASYYNAGGGCYVGGSLVLRPNGSVSRVDELTAGDEVMAAKGESLVQERVRWVVETRTDAEAGVVLVTLPTTGNRDIGQGQGQGLQITPWHPVMWEGKWTFPADIDAALQKSTVLRCSAEDVPSVFNLVLEKGGAPVVAGVPAISPGHGLDDPVAAHPFYGTRLVLDHLAACAKTPQGRIVLEARDIVQHAEEAAPPSGVSGVSQPTALVC